MIIKANIQSTNATSLQTLFAVSLPFVKGMVPPSIRLDTFYGLSDRLTDAISALKRSTTKLGFPKVGRAKVAGRQVRRVRRMGNTMGSIVILKRENLLWTVGWCLVMVQSQPLVRMATVVRGKHSWMYVQPVRNIWQSLYLLVVTKTWPPGPPH